MGKMKEIYTDVEEIMESIDGRFICKSMAYKVVLIEALMYKLEKRKNDLIDEWYKEDGHD